MSSSKPSAPSLASVPKPPLPAHSPTSPTSSSGGMDEKLHNFGAKIGTKVGDHIAIDIDPLPAEINFPHEEDNADTGGDPLKVFHAALGIPKPKPAKPKTHRNVLGRKRPPKPHEVVKEKPTKLTPANKGVYYQVLGNERWSRFRYSFCDGLLAGAMFLQILVGAAVTAFGAGSVSHVIITVFGATNTALASLLAVMKSQGLPNRLRQDWNGWRELREFIEEKEREIDNLIKGHGEGVEDFDVWAVVREIEARYKTMRLTLEANRPDTYIKVPPSLR